MCSLQAQSDLTAVATDKIELQERVEHLNSIINDLRKSNEKYSEQTRHDGDTIGRWIKCLANSLI